VYWTLSVEARGEAGSAYVFLLSEDPETIMETIREDS